MDDLKSIAENLRNAARRGDTGNDQGNDRDLDGHLNFAVQVHHDKPSEQAGVRNKAISVFAVCVRARLCTCVK